MLTTRTSRSRTTFHHKRRIGYGFMGAAALMMAVHAASASTTYSWLASPANDNWDQESTNWFDGTSDVAWANNLTGDSAVFNVPSTTITVTEQIAVTNIIFDTDGWVLNAGPSGSLVWDTTNGFGGAMNFTVAAGDTATVNAPIGPGGVLITMFGPGTLILGGQNTTQGATTVSGGTLKLTGSIAAGSPFTAGTITTTGGGAFVLAGNTGSIQGGTGAPLTMEGGTFVYDNTGATGAKSQGMKTLTFGVGDNTIQNIQAGATSSTLTFSGLTSPRAVGAVGNFISGGATDTSNAIVISSLVVMVAGNPTNVTLPAGFISQGLFFNGADYAVMNAADTYVRAPVYGVDTGAGFNFVAADTTGASLADSSISNYLVTTTSIASQSSASANTIKFGGGGTVNMTLAGNATLNLVGGGLLVSGDTSTTISGSGTANVTGGTELVFRTDTASDSLTINVPIVGVNPLTKSGAGTLTLNGANTYTGATTVSGGVLQAGVATVANVSGAFGNNSAVVMANYTGALLDLNNLNQQIGSITGGGSGGGNVALETATLTVGGDNTSPAAYAGSIYGGGGVTKIGTGLQMLSGRNTYSGSTVVSAGTLEFVTEMALYNGNTTDWNAAQVTVAPGATLALSVGGAGQFTAADVQTINANIGFASGALLGLDNRTGGVFNYANVITNATGGNSMGVNIFTGNAGDQLTLSGNNTYTGSTVVSAGWVEAGVASVPNVSGAFGNNSAVTLVNVAGVHLDITGFNTQIGSLTGGPLATVTLGAATLTIGGDNTSPAAYAGTISSTGAGSLVKIGTGTLTLSGASSYTGTTSVTSGTLRLNGVITSATTVGNTSTPGLTPILGGGTGASTGGTLNSNGTQTYLNSTSVGDVQAAVTILGPGSGSAGHLAPGNSVGTLSVNSLALNSGAVLDYEFNSTANDLTFVNGTGALTIGTGTGTVGVNLYQEGATSPYAFPAGTKIYDLIRYDPTVTIGGDGVSDLTVLNPIAGDTYVFGTTTIGVDNYVILTVTGASVPEPASLALLGLGALGLLKRRRR